MSGRISLRKVTHEDGGKMAGLHNEELLDVEEQREISGIPVGNCGRRRS